MQTLFPAVCLSVITAAQPGVQVRMDWSQTAERQAELAAVRSEYIEAVNEGDAQRAAEVYSTDALAVIGDSEILRGEAAVAQHLRNALATSSASVTLVPRTFSKSGRLGSETGTYTIAGAGTARPIEGVYVTVYARGADGRWRIAMEVRTDGRGKGSNLW